jgi:hypothetical protein
MRVTEFIASSEKFGTVFLGDVRAMTPSRCGAKSQSQAAWSHAAGKIAEWRWRNAENGWTRAAARAGQNHSRQNGFRTSCSMAHRVQPMSKRS